MDVVSDQEFWDFRKKLNHPPEDDVNFTCLANVAPNLDVRALQRLKLAARFTHSGAGEFHRVRILGEGREGLLHVEYTDYGSVNKKRPRKQNLFDKRKCQNVRVRGTVLV